MSNYNIHVISTNRADISLLYELVILLQNSDFLNTKVIFIGEISKELDFINEFYPIKNKEFIGNGINYSDTHNIIKQTKLLAIDYSEYIKINKKVFRPRIKRNGRMMTKNIFIIFIFYFFIEK